MKIAIFDYRITRNNAVGSCHLRMLEHVCLEHEFTIFAVEFENPSPGRIRWVRIPAPRRPLALLYVAFHLLAPLYYASHRMFHRVRFDLVQVVESNLAFGDIVYSHSCHHMFLQRYWREAGATGLRGAVRWLDHWLHSLLEPRVYRAARRIVVPSQGFARELAETYPFASAKMQVLANPVDTEALRRPESFDRDTFRARLHLDPEDIVLAFVAHGHYELKGLPLLLAALAEIHDPRLKLLVVGGSSGLVSAFRRRADQLGLNSHVTFLGDQKDVRPYLWAADALVHPSRHEVFPLATLEAAAAGLPLLVTRLNGVEEFFRDGENGLLLQRDVPSLSACLRRFAQIPAAIRQAMGDRAQAAVQRYNSSEFALNWSKFYAEVQAHVR
jgi:glycosyltransferase involved in cell wall biosynthesis